MNFQGLLIILSFCILCLVLFLAGPDIVYSLDVPSCCPQLGTPKNPLVVPPPQILVSPRVGPVIR